MHFFLHSLLFFLFLPVIQTQLSIADLEQLANEGPSAEEIQNRTYVEEQSNLQQQILLRYDRHTRPAADPSQPTVVLVHLNLLHFAIQEKSQSMRLYGHMFMTWFDEKAVWKPSDFNGIRSTHVSQWEIWQPDIKTANSISGVNQFFEISKRSHAMLTSIHDTTTKVEIFPTFSISVGCDLDFSDYPFDEQECSLLLYTSSPMKEVEMKIYFDEPPSISLSWDEKDVQKKRHISNWELVSIMANVTYFRNRSYNNTPPKTEEESAVTWSILQYTIKLKRNTFKYWFTLALSGVASMWLNALSFLIYQTETAIALILCNFFIQVVFMYDSVDLIPISSTGRPNVLIFTILLLIFTALALLLHFCLRLFAQTPWSPPVWFGRVPQQVREFVLSFTDKPDEATSNVEESDETEERPKDEQPTEEPPKDKEDAKEAIIIGPLLRKVCIIAYFVLVILLCPLLFM